MGMRSLLSTGLTKVGAGNTWTVTTYGTHPWLIANPRNEIVGIFVPYTAARDTDIIIK